MARGEVKPCREPADVEANIKKYLGDRDPAARNLSFDYCYNYFQSYRDRGDIAGIAASQNRQLSCLHLGFFLASWGMYRGSGDLWRRSSRHLVPLIETIAQASPQLWAIDAHSYSDAEWAVLNDFRRQIKNALPNGTTDTLMTKIMLGVFGNVPAFDTQFIRGSRVSTYSAKQLLRVEQFYQEHSDVIDRHRVRTLDFETGKETGYKYTRAKVIDMIFVIEGSR